MIVGMVEPAGIGPGCNPGWHMINAGARYVLGGAIPGAEFVSLPMMQPWSDEQREIAKDCDLLVLSGNPRYDAGDHQWLYRGVMDEMLATGVPCIDAWAGACVGQPGNLDDDARALLDTERNQSLVDRIRNFRFAITRDSLAQRVNEMAGIRSIQLPCSSYWAADWMVVESIDGIDDVFVPHYNLSTDFIRRFAGWRVVATERRDAERCIEAGIQDFETIDDPRGLIYVYAAARRVVSGRLHAAIPAARFGAEVAIVAFDSRPQAADAFGIPWADESTEPAPLIGRPVACPTEVIREWL